MEIVIYGIGDLARELYSYMKFQFNILGFCADDEYLKELNFFCEKPVLSLSELFRINTQKKIHLITAIGYKNMRKRKKKYMELKEIGFYFTNYIHKNVEYESDLKIGENNIIFPGTIIEPEVKIGNNNVIWSKNLICHNAEIGSHNFIAAGSLVGGFSKILDNNFIGFSSTIIQGKIIEKEILIGAQSLVIKNPSNFSKNFGIPSKEINYHFEKGIEID